MNIYIAGSGFLRSKVQKKPVEKRDKVKHTDVPKAKESSSKGLVSDTKPKHRRKHGDQEPNGNRLK